VTGRGGGAELTRLIERSGELKRDLVDFVCSPRLERSLAAAMAEAGLEEFEDADAIGIIDRFALQGQSICATRCGSSGQLSSFAPHRTRLLPPSMTNSAPVR